MRWRPGHYLTVGLVGAVIIGAFVVLAPRSLFEPRGGPYPEACGQWGYDERRCEAIVRDAAELAGTSLDDTVAIELLAFDPKPGLAGPHIARVRFRFADGRTQEQDVWCGVAARPACPGGLVTPGDEYMDGE